jgi:uncharacterized protein (TIGR03118 family)
MRSWLRRLRRAFDTRPSPRKPRPRPLAAEALEERALLAVGFLQSNIVSSVTGLAAVTDSQLINPWGLTTNPGGEFWVSDNQNGLSTLYNGLGAKAGLIVSIPSATTTKFTHATPTGIVFNSDANPNDFKVGGKSSFFLFDTLDGTIDGWGGGTSAVPAPVTVPGAVYTGLAIGTDAAGDGLIYTADWGKGTVDVFNGSFTQVDKTAFVDHSVPSGFRPFGIQDIGGNVWVTYAKFDPTTGADTGTGGFVAEFSGDGKLELTIQPQGWLNSPWGLAMAPGGFGNFSGDLLVGNFGDGTINAFNPHNGKFVGQLSDAARRPIVIGNLWAIQFGNGTADQPANTLFFTAGLVDAPQTGIFGATAGLLGSLQALPKINPNAPLLPNLKNGLKQTFSTVAANGDQNPYGVAFVPSGFKGSGKLQAGDLLVSNFNNKGATGGQQGLGSTIVRVTPQGATSTFFTGTSQLGLTTALGVLKGGFVIVGSVPTDPTTGAIIPGGGSLLILDANGTVVKMLTDSDLLDSPWDLTINDQGGSAQVFVSNAVSGTVTRIDLAIVKGAKAPKVESETAIGSGFASKLDKTALILGPTGLAYNAMTDTLYVASTEDNTIFAIPHAGTRTFDGGTGRNLFAGHPNPHLRGPLGLVLAPNGDLIVANGDAVNADSTGAHNSELVEFTPQGKFVSAFQVDTTAGSAFGLTAVNDNGLLRFAAVDDTTNTVSVWSFDSHK